MSAVPGAGLDADEVARLSTEAMWSGDAASRMLGMRVLEVGPGRASVAMTVRADMLNGYATCHGGLLAALADSAFGVACNSHGQVTVAAGFDISFLEPGRLGDELVAHARQVVLRGRSGLYDVTVRRVHDDGVVAEFRGRSRSLGRANPGLTPPGSAGGAAGA